MSKKEALEAMQDFANQFAAANPGVADIIEKTHSGELDEDVAMKQLMDLVCNDPSLQASLMEQAMVTLGASEEQIQEMPAIFQAPTGLPRWDPLWEARLAERLQFDDEAPELRHGALQEGATPAVPVANAGTNPVALGWSLRQASDEVVDEIQRLTAHINSEEPALTATTTIEEMALATQPEGFKPGQLPVPREVSGPTGGEIALLSKEEQQTLAWGSFSTTHGRRSSAPTLATMIVNHLRKRGFTIDVGSHGGSMKNSLDNVEAKAAWVVSIAGAGPLATNESFNLMENAAASIASDLAQALSDKVREGYGLPSAPTVEVCTVDAYEDRQVGWAALVRG